MHGNSIAKLIIVDDEVPQMTALCNTLEHEGYTTVGFASAKEALAALQEKEFDLLLTDLMMSEMDGISLLRAAIEIDSTLVGIVMTGHGAIGTAVEAMKAGALDYIQKPFKLSAVLPVLARALAVKRLRMENIQLREAVGIYELSMAVAFAQDFGTVLNKVADAAFQQSAGSEISILLPTQDGKELRVAAARGPNAEAIHGKRVRISHALSGWVSHSHEFLSKLDELADVQPVFTPPLREISGAVSVPMLFGGKLVGILSFTPARPHHSVRLGQIKALNILASAAASALEAASLLEQLRDAEQRYRRLTENAPDIVFRYELEPRRSVAYINTAVEGITGFSPDEYYGDPNLIFKVVYPEDRELLEDILSGSRSSGNTSTLRWQHKNGSAIWIELRSVGVRNASGLMVAVEGVARDITERRQLEEQFRQAQKMEAIGRLAGGIAHDFNNLLTAILGYSDFLLQAGDTTKAIDQDVQEIKKAGERAAELTRQLLAFSRKQILQPRVLDLNVLLDELEKMLRRLIGEDVTLVVRLQPEAGRIKADPGQIEQVVMNLALNARDAMPDGGKIIIETGNVELDDSYARAHMGARAGSHVMLAISDTGTGMTSEVQSRIFEPFFTTKEAGKGTGLGLATVYGIVKQSGGSIWVYSEVGRGTTFKVFLPRVQDAVAPMEPCLPAKAIQGSETVLVVEDDEGIRQLICTVLRKNGYEILAANRGSQAIDLSRHHQGQIHLMITDVLMPGMSIRELTGTLSEARPDMKVLYISGYTDDSISHLGILDSGKNFLQKPFTVTALARKIREVLEGR